MTWQQWLISMGFSVRSYSGRGMMGKECLGITVDNQGIYDAIWTLALLVGQYDVDAPSGDTLKVDSMGNGYIIYWSQVKWKD